MRRWLDVTRVAQACRARAQVPALGRQQQPQPRGTWCSASDLCGPTWHACLDGPDVESHSPTGGCESIVSPDDEAFFVVMTGASPQGVCYHDPSATMISTAAVRVYRTVGVK